MTVICSLLSWDWTDADPMQIMDKSLYYEGVPVWLLFDPDLILALSLSNGYLWICSVVIWPDGVSIF